MPSIPAARLTASEHELVVAFRQLPPPVRDAVLLILVRLAAGGGR